VGVIVEDTVSFANFTIANKPFGMATALDQEFLSKPQDGIIGMANSILSDMDVYTFFEILVLAEILPDPSFSVYLSRSRDYLFNTSLQGGSNMCLGCMATAYNQQTVGGM
jgi:hypothetical protein